MVHKRCAPGPGLTRRAPSNTPRAARQAANHECDRRVFFLKPLDSTKLQSPQINSFGQLTELSVVSVFMILNQRPSSTASLVRDTAAIDSPGASPPLPAPVPEPPTQDTSAVIILAAVIGSLVFAVAFLWMTKRIFGDLILQSAMGVRRRGRVSSYVLPISSSASSGGEAQ